MMMDNELMPASGLLGSVGDLGNNSDSLRIYTSMPVLEDGLSSGHASDTDNNNPTVMLMKRQINEIEKEIIQRTRNDMLGTNENDSGKDISLNVTKDILHTLKTTSPDLFVAKKENSYDTNELQLDGLDPLGTPPPPAPQGRQSVSLEVNCGEVEAAIKDIRMALQRTKTLPVKSPSEDPPEPSVSPIWIPRYFVFRFVNKGIPIVASDILWLIALLLTIISVNVPLYHIDHIRLGYPSGHLTVSRINASN